MSEIALIQAQVDKFALDLGGRVRRICDALGYLRHETVLRFQLSPADAASIDRWLEADDFATDASGFFQSQRRLARLRAGDRLDDRVAQFWSATARNNPAARARLFALRDIGERLHELHASLKGIAWIYYQDVTNTAVLYPYHDVRRFVPSTFDWRGYHTFASVTAAADPDRAVRWTPPSVDYGGEGIITSASLPVYVDDRMVGLWSIDVPLRMLHHDCIHERFAPEHHNLIVDLDGFIIAHESIPAEIDTARGSVLRKPVGELGGGFAGIDLRAIAQKGSGTLDLRDVNGEELLVGYRVVRELGWVFFATYPRSRMIAELNRKVVDAFERIRSGNLSYRIDPAGDGDAAQLAVAYNAMSEALESDRAARQRAEKELKRANAAKDRFIAMLSHELRTPLSPVLAAVSWLRRDPSVPARLAPILELILRNVALEARLIDDLLDLSAIAHGKVRFKMKVVDAHEVIARAVETCRAEIAAAKLELSITASERAPEHHVEADPERLQQTLWNLLRNAVKFTPAGGKIAVRCCNPRPGRIRIEVSDTGIGIAPGERDRIFAAFEQVERSDDGEQESGRRRRRGRGGLGIGLAIAKGIMHAHGGSLEVESAGPGEGSTFALEMDTCPRPQAEARPKRWIVRPRQSLEVLVVEDHLDTAEILAFTLDVLGHRATIAHTATDALRQAEARAFDAVLSDIGLPDMTGYEFLQKLRAHSQAPAIALSGFGQADDLRRSEAAGFRRHLTKPIRVEQLEGALEDVVLAPTAPRSRTALAGTRSQR